MPIVRETNKAVVDIVLRYAGILVSRGSKFSPASIDSDTIRFILDLEEIESSKLFIQKLITFISEILKVQRESNE